VEQVGSSISRGYFSASNGVLVYRTGGAPSSELVWHDQGGRRVGNAGGSDDYGDIAVAPDASRVVYSRMVGAVGAGTPDLWVLDIARGIQSRLTVQPDGARAPVWSRDGKYVAYTNVRGPGKLIVKAPGSAMAERVLFRSASGKFVTDWSRDGRFLVYTDVSTKTAADVYAIADPLTTADPKPIPVVVTEFNDAQGQISPDGHWLAYSSNEAGRYDIYVRPFPPDESRREKWVVSSAGGLQPRWRADGKELFYFSPDRRFMAVDIHAGNGFQAGTPRPLFESPLFAVSATLFRYDVSPDGKRFLLILPTAGAAAAPVTVVLNWESALKRQEN
jgi:Tol biopolymer transport system component